MKPQKLVKKKSRKDIEKSDFFYILPIIIALAVVPLIVFLKINVLQGIQKDLWTGGEETADFFSYYKYIVLLLTTVAGIFSLLIKKMNNNLRVKLTYAYVPIAVYVLFVLLSTLLSQYKDVATSGFVDRFEGVYVLLAYSALTFITINLINTERQIKYVINALLISSAILGLIGLSQYLGIDFFGTPFGKQLILPPQYQNAADHLNFRFGEFMVYATLYNPNYVGSYIVLVLPVCLGIFIYERKIAKKVLLGLLAIVLFICLLGSRSMAGVIGLIATGIISLLFFRRFIYKHIKPFAIAVAGILILLLGFNYITGSGISQRISNLFKEGMVSWQAPKEAYVKDIITKDNSLQVITDKNSILLKADKGALSFFGDNNEKLIPKRDQNTVTMENEDYSLYKFQITNEGYVDCYIGSKVFKIIVQGNSIKPAGLRGQPIDVSHPEKLGFDRYESVLSARGFIWSRTLPLLKNTIFAGHGPDTFPIYFPQEDIIGKLNAYGVTNIFVDKPHNLYIQMAINTGVVSMLAFFVLLMMYLVTSLKLYLKKGNLFDYKYYIGVSIFCGICGYCVTSLANDSVISVAPVFWVLLGVGITCNILFKKTSLIAETKKGRR